MIVDYNNLEVCQIELTTECGAGCPQCPRNVYGGKTVEDLPICELSLDDIKNIYSVIQKQDKKSTSTPTSTSNLKHFVLNILPYYYIIIIIII